MNIIEIEKHKSIIVSINNLLKIIDNESDIKKLKSISRCSRNALDIFNKVNLTVIDPTKAENSNFWNSAKRIAYGRCVDSYYKRDKYEEKEEVLCSTCKENRKQTYDGFISSRSWDYCKDCFKMFEEIYAIYDKNRAFKQGVLWEFEKAVNRTVFGDLKDKWLLWGRSVSSRSRPKPIEVQIKEMLKNEMEKIFIEQNKELVIKYSNEQ